MREVHAGWLWAGAAACVLAGALLHTMHLWATGEPLQLVLAVAFWFAMSMASALAVLALRVGVLVPPPGGVPRARLVLVGTLASVLGIAFVLGATASSWGIFTAAPVAVGLASLAVDALLGLLEVAAGTLLALLALTVLMASPPPKNAGIDAARPGRESLADQRNQHES